MKLFLAGIPESLRSEGCAPRRTRPASGHYSFSDCALYRERCLRVTGDLAQATAFCNGRLLQSPRRRVDRPIRNRHWPGSVAMAARRRDTERQPTAAYDLRADFGVAHSSFFAGYACASARKATRRVSSYFAVTLLALMMITLTGHLGGILSGVESP